MTAPQEPTTPWVYAEPLPPAETRRKRRLPLFIAAGTVIALILGGVAYAGMKLWFGSGAQPEEAAPSTVVAFARLDFSPGYGQRMKINNLAKKFPRESGQDAVDELKKEIFDTLGVDKTAFAQRVEPWFADRAGVGLWLRDKRPYALVVLSSKDDGAARTGLAELQRKKGASDLGFVVRDGFALVAVGERDAQAAADTAAADAQRESLAEAAAFRRGADWLPDNQTAIAWLDLGKLGDTVSTLAEGFLGEFAGSDAGFPKGLKGQLILGAQATDNGADIRFRMFGSSAPAATNGNAKSIVDSLPGNSVLAGSLRVGDLGQELAGSMFRTPDLDELLKDMPKELADEARKNLGEMNRRTTAMTKAIESLSGARVTVAASAVGEDRVALSASAEVSAADKATALADALKLLGDDVTVTASGTKVSLTTKGYAASGGKLSEQPLYREALAGAYDRATDVLFVDVQKLVADAGMPEKERREIAPLKAIGLSTSVEGGDPVGLIRLVIR